MITIGKHTTDSAFECGAYAAETVRVPEWHGHGRLLRRVVLSAGMAAVLLALAAGLYARFDGLGLRQLSVDEFYLVQSVSLILEKGVPEFDSGGYYARGLLVQYLTAASVWLIGDEGLAYRLPAAVFGVFSLGLFYVYCRLFMDRIFSAAAVATLLVSSWHIEFSRFARMYTALQCMTLVFLLSVEFAYFRNQWRYRYAPHVMLVVTVLCHSLGVLLAPLLALPCFIEHTRARLRAVSHAAEYVCVTGLTVFACAWYVQFPFLSYGAIDRFPLDYVPWGDESMFRTSVFPFWSLAEDPVVNLAVVWGLLLGTSAILALLKLRGWQVRPTDFVGSWMVISAALHAFMVSLICAGLLLFRFGVHKVSEHPKRTFAMVGASVALVLFWLGYALAWREWVEAVDGGGFGLAWGLRRVFFGWPDFYTPMYAPWAKQLPVLGGIVLIAVAYLLATMLHMPLVQILRHPAFVVAYLVVCFGVLSSVYEETRFLFFIYPLMLLCVALAIGAVVTRLANVVGLQPKPGLVLLGPILYATLFTVTEDFNPRHIMNVASERVSFRMAEYEPFARTWFARSDYRSPAIFLNKGAKADERSQIIVIGEPPVSYYLRRAHAVYYPREGPLYFLRSRERGTKNVWSDNRLLGRPEEVREFTAGARTVWLVRPRPESQQAFRVEEVWGERIETVSQMYVSVDGRIEVVRITLT